MKKRTMLTVAAFCACLGVSAGAEQPAGSRRAMMQLHQIKAIDECGSGVREWGHDKITVGAVVVEHGTVRVRTFNAGRFGHDGSARNYNPPRDFVGVKIKPGMKQLYQVYLTMAERDASAGFGPYLEKFAARVRAKLPPEAAANGNGGNLALAAAAAVAAPLTTASVIVIGKEVLAEMTQILKDDIFSHSLAQLQVTGADFTFNGDRTSPKKTLTFKAKDCKYSITYSWALER